MTATLPPPGAHGGDGPRVAEALGLDPATILDLSASMNPAAPDPAPFVAAHLEALGRYPDAGGATCALAAVLGADDERVLLTNGGAEAIALVAGQLRRGWVDAPDFSLYARHLETVEPGAPRWRSDPHNPTGTLAGPDEDAAVWDEAFFPLATGRWTSGRADRGAIVVGSLTKLFACPGLRVGFVLVPPGAAGGDLMARLRAAQPQWSVNGLAAAVLPDLIASADLTGWAAEVVRLRRALVDALAARGHEVLPSAANYVLVSHAGSMRTGLARRGVVVRDCASFGLPGHVRIAVPDDCGRARLLEALDALIPADGQP